MDLGEPDFVAAMGTKWWLDKSVTSYAASEDSKGVSLPGYKCFIVETRDKYRTRLLFNENSACVFEGGNLEEISAEIDMIKMAKLFSRGADNEISTS